MLNGAVKLIVRPEGWAPFFAYWNAETRRWRVAGLTSDLDAFTSVYDDAGAAIEVDDDPAWQVQEVPCIPRER